MEKKVQVRVGGEAKRFSVRINDQALRFDDQGKADHELSPQKSQVVTYYAAGEPGTPLSVEIVGVWRKEFRVPRDGITGGSKKFKVSWAPLPNPWPFTGDLTLRSSGDSE